MWCFDCHDIPNSRYVGAMPQPASQSPAPTDPEQAFDRQVGERLKAYRRAARLSQTELGRRIGVTFQQVQKYENGFNRIAASRLWLVARCLGVPVTALIGDDEAATSEGPASDVARLLQAWRAMDPAHRAPLLTLMENLGTIPRSKRGHRPTVTT
ncbi:helix-turn-helix domain-containing protein [Brevundimonas sp. SL130]|uniref:helix-turn-helix domain-containing protein n=1 Tax=Brevundimonas sp. SL130 TaxID=2995143 RepID=UPI00226CEE8F|nr:helix-turn-helix domain-containing protein [Brevundimonas sp. SL130]WAC61324.1 helix-turn-helix domain-containing protein [Brevundimonas sp. SL130]